MSLLLLAMAAQLQVVTIDQAVDAALANHPEAQVARASVGIARARVRQARAPLLPDLGASASYSYSARDGVGVPLTHGDAYSASLSAGVLLWDFGRARDRWRSAEASAEATAGSAAATVEDLVLAVRLAFIDAREARALIRVAEETLSNQERHLAETEAFVEIGAKPAIDLARLRTQVAEARAARVRAENSYQLAKVRLARGMGVPDASFEVADAELPPVEGEVAPAGDMAAAATRSRPELVAQKASIRAQSLSLDAARKWFLPQFRVGASASYFGDDWAEPAWAGSLGVSMSWNIFDGFGSSAAVDVERLGVVIEEARLSTVEQSVWQDVTEARIGLESATAQIESAAQGLESARELLRMAEERYQAGVGSSLELADAQLGLTGASAQVVRVDNDVAAARARLLRALGRRAWQ
jgi:outer membrane protein